MNIPFLAPCGRCTTKDWVSVLLWQREKKDESHASGYKTVFAGKGDATSRPFLTITAHRQKKIWEVARTWAQNSPCNMRKMQVSRPFLTITAQWGSERKQYLNKGGFQENFAKEIINRSPPMCTKSQTSGKLAHSVHDQRSVEYVGPILSSLSRLHGGFMQRTGHREVGAEQAQSWGRMWPTEKETKGEIKHTGKISICLTVTGSRLMTPAAYSSETNFRTEEKKELCPIKRGSVL
ncbi:hypothetical protein C8F04DRAFT_1347771 [Mycena alexandri]|uniref:Uncharacterized protein n=1 Tax=Mycena alexandri TaxID=1745969 RepID=A0AAD6SW41_9AGAR|nr:hypothetical protein C8F04DRAFT_1347771 [Mycena alexandri]